MTGRPARESRAAGTQSINSAVAPTIAGARSFAVALSAPPSCKGERPRDTGRCSSRKEGSRCQSRHRYRVAASAAGGLGLLALLASGCATGLGPKALRSERPDDNQQYRPLRRCGDAAQPGAPALLRGARRSSISAPSSRSTSSDGFTHRRLPRPATGANGTFGNRLRVCRRSRPSPIRRFRATSSPPKCSRPFRPTHSCCSRRPDGATIA